MDDTDSHTQRKVLESGIAALNIIRDSNTKLHRTCDAAVSTNRAVANAYEREYVYYRDKLKNARLAPLRLDLIIQTYFAYKHWQTYLYTHAELLDIGNEIADKSNLLVEDNKELSAKIGQMQADLAQLE